MQVPEIAPPETWGQDSLEWLESCGIIPTVPDVYPSHFNTACRDEFRYYLVHRLGIRPAFEYSEALSRGSWLHLCAEYWITLGPAVWEDAIRKVLETRLKELRKVCDVLRLSEEKTATILEKERNDALCTVGWWNAYLDTPITPTLTLHKYLTSSNLRHLGSEVHLSMPNPAGKRVYPLLAAYFDHLYYNPNTNQIWDLDFKTTSKSCIDRLKQAPYEFATLAHLTILEHHLTSLAATYDLPASVSVGGMIHVALRKPTITLGQRDRPHHFACTGKRSGLSGTARPRPDDSWYARTVYDENGLLASEVTFPPSVEGGAKQAALAWLHGAVGVKPKETYYGEPSIATYTGRVLEWATGVGHYAEEGPSRAADPVVNISETAATILDDSDEWHQFSRKLKMVGDLAIRYPLPSNFIRPMYGMSDGRSNKPSPFAPFYTSHPRTWPTIIEQEGFILKNVPQENPDD